MKSKIQKFYILLLITGCWLLVADSAQAASLYFSPSSGGYVIGNTLSVSVYISSTDQAMNAASGVISFPQDKLEVISFSKNGSVFSLWVQEPSFSSSAGTINFEGIVLNPGYTGSAGKIITVNFKARAVGSVPLLFSSGSVLANDGKGTNILTEVENASFRIDAIKSEAPEITTPSKAAGVPPAPKIRSLTNPDPDKWYAESDQKFIWDEPEGTTGVKLLIDKEPVSMPTVYYNNPISEKIIENLDDGIWYFHVQLKNKFGWGETAHYRVQIDTHPPEFLELKFIDDQDTITAGVVNVFDSQLKIFISATDSLSGIDFYKIKIGDGDFFNPPSDAIKDNIYTLPSQTAGRRNILVRAYDRAGNYITKEEEFNIVSADTSIAWIQSLLFSKIFDRATPALVLNILLVSLIFLLFALSILFWRFRRKIKNLKREIRKGVEGINEGISKAFELLREDVRDYMKKIKNERRLIAGEEKIIDDILNDFDDTEKFLEKKVNDIKKVIK